MLRHPVEIGESLLGGAFILTHSMPVDKPYKEVAKYTARWEDMLRDLPPLEYRYEFDVGPDRLELAGVLSRRENENRWKAAELPGWCWGQAVKKAQALSQKSPGD